MTEKTFGAVVGRWQVLHNDHLRYILAAAGRRRHLIIGVTNPDPGLTRPEASDPDRHRGDANPLTYFERCLMIKDALLDEGLSLDEFTLTPLPINTPELLPYYLPLETTVYLTIYDDWGRQKQKRFLEQGYEVKIIWERAASEKGISGTMVRRLMAEGGPWEDHVPSSTIALARSWGLPERMKKMLQD